MSKKVKYLENFIKNRPQKVELRDVKTLNGLSNKIGSLRSRVNSRMNEHEDAGNAWVEAINERKEWDDIVQEFPDEYPIEMSISMKDQVDVLHLEADKLEQKFEKEIKDNIKQYKNLQNKRQKAIKEEEDKRDLQSKSDNKWGPLLDEIHDFEVTYKKELKSFISNAKKLGLTPNVSEYNDDLSKIRQIKGDAGM